MARLRLKSLRGSGLSSGQLLDAMGNPRTYWFPIFYVVERLGVRIHFVPEPGWEVALQTEKDQTDLWLRAEAPAERRRYNAAHALGLFLRSKYPDFRDVVPMTNPCQAARRASLFASALLMPRYLFEPLIYHSAMTAQAMAKLFGVPQLVVEDRISWVTQGRPDL